MKLFTKFFHKNTDRQDHTATGGMEDFMTLIRVYFQAAMASKIGITNLAMLPDLRIFKQTLHVPTVNNRLGLGEKNRCRKMLEDVYGLKENFFKEIDDSIKKNCRSLNDVQSYLFMFQGFSQDLVMLLSNMLQVKLRIPSIFKKTLRSVVAGGIQDIQTKNNWKDDAQRKAAVGVRTLQKRLGFSGEWMLDYAFQIILLAKKEPKPKDQDTATDKS